MTDGARRQVQLVRRVAKRSGARGSLEGTNRGYRDVDEQHPISEPNSSIQDNCAFVGIASAAYQLPTKSAAKRRQQVTCREEGMLLRGKTAIISGAASPRGHWARNRPAVRRRRRSRRNSRYRWQCAHAAANAASIVGEPHIGLACNVADQSRFCEQAVEAVIGAFGQDRHSDQQCRHHPAGEVPGHYAQPTGIASRMSI